MSFEKGILYKKEFRKSYRGAKAVDRTCRNHGSCEWCQGNRKYKNQKRLEKMLDKEKEMNYNKYIR